MPPSSKQQTQQALSSPSSSSSLSSSSPYSSTPSSPSSHAHPNDSTAHVQSPDIIAVPASPLLSPDTETHNDNTSSAPSNGSTNSDRDPEPVLPLKRTRSNSATVSTKRQRLSSSASNAVPPLLASTLRRSSRRLTGSQVDYSPKGLKNHDLKKNKSTQKGGAVTIPTTNSADTQQEHPKQSSYSSATASSSAKTRRAAGSIKQEESASSVVVVEDSTHRSARPRSRTSSANGSTKRPVPKQSAAALSNGKHSTASASPPAEITSEHRELLDKIQEKQKQLSDTFERHDSRVRLLFHLEKFVSLVSFDPKVAKQDHSNVFEEYHTKYDLWAKVQQSGESSSSGRSRSTRRRGANLQKDVFSNPLTTGSPAPPGPSTPPTSGRQSTRDDTVADHKPTQRGRRPSSAAHSESPKPVAYATRRRGGSSSSNGTVSSTKPRFARSDTKSSSANDSQFNSRGHAQVGSKNLSSLIQTSRRLSSRYNDGRYSIKGNAGADDYGDHDYGDNSDGYITDDFDEILFLDNSPAVSDAHVEEEDDSSDEEKHDKSIEFISEEAAQHRNTPRLKVKFSLPEATVTHPGHIATPHFDSLDDFLGSFVLLDEEVTEEQREEYIQDQAELRNRIEQVKANGMYEVYLEHLLELSGNNGLAGNATNNANSTGQGAGSTGSVGTNAIIPSVVNRSASSLISKLRKTFQDPIRQSQPPTHQDHLVSQAIYFAKLMTNERRSHVTKSKKVASMVDLYFKRLSNAEEKERKQEEKRIKQLARKTALEVMRKWKIAEKVVQHRRAKKLEDEQRQAGKQQLNMILEHSAQLLEARVATSTDATASAGSTKRHAEDSDENDDNDHLFAASDSDHDAEMAASEDEAADDDDESMPDHDEDKAGKSNEANDQPNEPKHKQPIDSANDKPNSNTSNNHNFSDIPDDQLTVEQLQQKYATLPDVKLKWDHSEDEEGDDDADQPVFEDEDRVKRAIQMDEDENVSDSDHSTVMDSEDDMDISDESLSDDGEEGEEGGLAALFKSAPEEAKSKAKATDEESEYNETDKSSSTKLIKIDEEEEDEAEDGKAVGSRASSLAQPDSKAGSAPPASTEPLTKTTIPFLLRGSLREYQHYGLDWLVGLYNSNTNGILADEMGLGKTIQTISLISYLACEKQIWGPHLIVVPTSVMLNWEMEFKRFAPGFKVLTYYGNPMQRKQKRQGWNKEDTWHVCITSYQLVLQDQNAFKRKRWHYMILDEAHNIKNFRSQRWQSLLNFNTKHRLLLTGTPLQNNLMELWSLLYFLMPSSRTSQSMPEGFANLRNFQEWFSRPVEKMVEGGEYVDEEVKETVSKLHQILRPFLLRRLKADVEKQMPAKYEHVVYCKLSKRQRFLYDDFMSRAQTRETLASGNFLSIINCLMQLRKVCNHPDLFEVRPIVTSLAVNRSVAANYEIKDLLIRKRLVERADDAIDEGLNLDFLNLQFTQNDFKCTTSESISTNKWGNSKHPLIQEILSDQQQEVVKLKATTPKDLSSINGHLQYMNLLEKEDELIKLESTIYQSHNKCERTPVYGTDLIEKLSSVVSKPKPARGYNWNHSGIIGSMMLGYEEREETLSEVIERYAFVTPKAVCLDMPRQVLGPRISELLSTMPADDTVHGIDEASQLDIIIKDQERPRDEIPESQSLWMTPDLKAIQSQTLFHQNLIKLSIAFPDKRLLQFDCGKLQRLAELMHDLIANGHRALIFTQMTRVLDILEQFLNLHGWRYLRLDGATKIEQRQILTERFNHDPKIPIFILSTRSGGLGINLTGADTVIFYDSDWNPSMDKQCQDRCHRIGQTRDVHIYRLVSEYTIESNILRKAQQKQMLDNVVIQEGEFTTDYFTKLSVRDMLGDESLGGHADEAVLPSSSRNLEKILAVAEDDEDAKAAAAAMKEVSNLDAEDFDETQRQQQHHHQNAISSNASTETRNTRINTPTSEGRSSSAPEMSATPGPGAGEDDEEEEEEEGAEDQEEEDDEDGEGEDGEGINSVDDYMIRFIENGYYWD